MKQFFQNINQIEYSKKYIAFILLLIVVFITCQNLVLGKAFYNNYLIFKYSFYNLICNNNLYVHYPNYYGDLYKYSPTFALGMFPFYYLPNAVGIFLWDILNVSVFFIACIKLKSINYTNAGLLLLLSLFELFPSTQNSQSNVLILGLSILTFINFEKNKPFLAILFIVIGIYIKLFSLITCVLILVYPQKLKNILYFIILMLGFALIPLCVINPIELYTQYLNWIKLLMNDHAASVGFSIYQYPAFLFPNAPFKLYTLLTGLVLLFVPFIKYKNFANQHYRHSYFCFVLIWTIIFNHRAESPTFIIALFACLFWLLSFKNTVKRSTIIGIVCIFTSIWTTDIMPLSVRGNESIVCIAKPFVSILLFWIILASFFCKKYRLAMEL